MESLFRFFLRYHVFLIFLLLEGVALTFVYNSSNYQQSNMLAAIDGAKGYVYSLTSEWTGYFGLKKENEQLSAEITQLRNELDYYKSQQFIDTTIVADSLGNRLYTYIPAEVIQNTTNKQHNNFIINIGAEQGVEPDMAVISEQGVVGVVQRTSDNFATVMSVLNTDFRVSAKLKRTGHFGPLMWDGVNTREAVLIEVPQHASVEVGDTIVTSGYSTIFPEGIMIGVVKDFEVKRGNFYEINVELSVDFGRLRYVNVVNSTHRSEIRELEKAGNSTMLGGTGK